MAQKLDNTFTRFPVLYRHATLSDSKQIKIEEAVKLTVEVQNYLLELICYVFPVIIVKDLVIGIKALAELEAEYNVSTGEV